jgi:SAM-dependent methyltransferase
MLNLFPPGSGIETDFSEITKMERRKLIIGAVMAALIVVTVIFAYDIIRRSPDIKYVPTPQKVVNKMLEAAKVGESDVVYDLGSGDGRIPIAAVKDFGAKRGVGVDIDPELIRKANENAQQAGVADKIEFIQGDLFTMDFSEATVVTLYLGIKINLKLRPQLLEQLKPGTRIVSHNYDMGDWKPEQTIKVENSTVYFWTVPER